MKVILKKTLPQLGQKGDIVDVKRGFGRNYLVPNGIAELATDEAVLRVEMSKKRKKEKKAEKSSLIAKLAKRVNQKKFRLSVKTSSGGKVYGTFGIDKVVEHLKKQWKIDKQNINIKLGLAQPIKEIGKYSVDVEISGGDQKKDVTIILEVVGQ